MNPTQANLSWIGIIRLGLVQTALGAIVVLTTSTLNRIMVVEYALPAMLPGALVGFHYAVQMSRPRWGFGSDVGGRRTPWIIGGMAVLGFGGALAAIATALMSTSFYLGLYFAIVGFALIGIGVGASGTSLLTLLATRVAANRRPAAASIVWIMMIAGFVITAITAGSLLDPYSESRLVLVSCAVSVIAFIVALLAIWGIEGDTSSAENQSKLEEVQKPSFKTAFTDVWNEPRARQFTIFVFVSMLAYSAQDLILEPFAGLVFNYTPGESTKLAGVQNGGVMLGMVLVALIGSGLGGQKLGSMRFWAFGGCMASALAFVGLAVSSQFGSAWPLQTNVFLLGLSNGVFAVAAIGSMMGLANHGVEKREGTRMGIWGAAQAVAFGLGGFLGTVAIDVTRALLSDVTLAYSVIFAAEALLFVMSGLIALKVAPQALARPQAPQTMNLQAAE
ncbi:MAG: BCD family MFS transporter [Rhizobiaceae bacterium]|nr:BCD family MFS transporter [Hyphomicrobiales bacterium]NRB30356.1 BCD family MFS transporter [Rhizobiaceae bacterium]